MLPQRLIAPLAIALSTGKEIRIVTNGNGDVLARLNPKSSHRDARELEMWYANSDSKRAKPYRMLIGTFEAWLHSYIQRGKIMLVEEAHTHDIIWVCDVQTMIFVRKLRHYCTAPMYIA